MKYVLLAALLAPSHAHAISSYLAPASSCASLQHAIYREGKAVIYTAPEIYFLAVRDTSVCMPGAQLVLKNTKTKDQPACLLFTCKE